MLTARQKCRANWFYPVYQCHIYFQRTRGRRDGLIDGFRFHRFLLVPKVSVYNFLTDGIKGSLNNSGDEKGLASMKAGAQGWARMKWRKQAQGASAMNYIGIDIHKKYSVACVQDERGHVVRRERIEGNSVEGFRHCLQGERARAVMRPVRIGQRSTTSSKSSGLGKLSRRRLSDG